MNLSRNPGGQYLCCDIVARLSNDVQCLIRELDHLSKLHTSYRLLQNRFNKLTNELEAKLVTIVCFKEWDDSQYEPLTTEHKIEEFATFIRLVWNSLHNRIDEKWAKAAHNSIVDGSPLAPTAVQILSFIAEITVKYQPYFMHGECSLEFTELSYQMNRIYPDLINAITLEPSLSYTWDMLPCLVNMSTLLDMYTATPRYDTISSFCLELIDGVTPHLLEATRGSVSNNAFNTLASLLRGDDKDLCTVPCVEHVTSRMPEFVHRMTEYLLGVSIPDKRPVPQVDSRFQMCRVQYRCTNNPYMYLQQIHPAVLNCYQPVYVSLLGGGLVLPTLKLQNPTPAKTRRRSQETDEPFEARITIKRQVSGRNTEASNDLPPIKLPRLSDSLIKPFDY
ncbi:hypothetical protein AAG570_013817 [Ranatra chinensis]|uniref:Uncharacterized protein n=1 Tax=Ranatra chinensis TaxID=642074 RepID=A0ABD0YD96_9HEMI